MMYNRNSWRRLPKVMSCLAPRQRGNLTLLQAALSIAWMCECLGPWHRGCQHSLYMQTHTHTCTYTRVPINLNHSAVNAYPPASLRDCLLGLKGLGWSKQGQSMCAFMSFELFHVISQHASARRSCLCKACVLSDQVKISCYFQMVLFKRLLWCVKSDLKCACRCLWFSPKARWQGMPFRV